MIVCRRSPSGEMKIKQLSNKSIWLWILTFTCFSLPSLSGCGATRQSESDNPTLTIEVLYADTQGVNTSPEPSAIWINSMEELGYLYAGFETLRLSAAATPVPEIDFNRFRVLLVEMGQKPTGGFSVNLNEHLSHISKVMAIVSLLWVEPEPETVLPQVITSPFMLLKIEKGTYTSVKVMDQHKQTLFELPITG